MESERIFHNWLIGHLKGRLSRDYSEININPEGEKNREFKGYYPDIILGSHGLVMGIVEIETEKSITPEKAKEWKILSRLGVKLMIIVPEKSKSTVMNLLWNEAIAQDVSIGSYNLTVKMP